MTAWGTREQGTKPFLVRNATIWTGGDAGREVMRGDVFMRNGIIVSVTKGGENGDLDEGTVVLEAEGAWLTPGIFDMVRPRSCFFHRSLLILYIVRYSTPTSALIPPPNCKEQKTPIRSFSRSCRTSAPSTVSTPMI